MPVGPPDHTPPPFFRQGTPALTKLALYSALALFLMAADTRLALTQPLRAALATALLPLQRALQWPITLAGGAGDYAQGLRAALAAGDAARAQLAQQSVRALQSEPLAAENARLRALLELRPALQVRSVSAEVMYEAADAYSRQVFIDRGARHGIALGAPVVNEAGVLGQVTRVYPLTSVVTLLTDRDAAIPVLNTRSQQRGAAFGGVDLGAAGGMELRFMAGNADLRVGDELATSGIDGVYPPGLPVARVVRIDRRAESGFARVWLAPVAPIDGVRHVLVLEPLSAQLPPRPAPAPAPDKLARTKGARR